MQVKGDWSLSFLSRSSFTNRVFLGTVTGTNKKNRCLDQGILKMGVKNVIKFFAPAGNVDRLNTYYAGSQPPG